MMKACRTLILSLSLFAGISCTKYLDIKPYGETIPQTAEEFSALLHNRLEDIDTGEEDIIGDVSSAVEYECIADNLEASLTSYPAGNSLKLYAGNYIEQRSWMYGRLYAAIRDCNIVIDNITEKESRLAKDVIGTAYALRGICYYNLLRNFCEPAVGNPDGPGVPLVTRFDMEEKPARSTIGQTVMRIESDFKEALSYDIEDPIFRFNNDVINGWLARLYFWSGDFDNAASTASGLLEKYPLLSGEAYKTMMGSIYTVTNPTEMILKSTVLSENSTSHNGTLSTIKARPVSRRFVELFAEKDKDVRYSISFTSKRVNAKNPFGCLRSSELQLILAESLYHKGDMTGALKALNDLRRNRISEYTDLTMGSLPPVNENDIISQDTKGNGLTPLLYAILCERRKELYMEGDRWYELKRNGRPEFWAARQGRKYTTMKFMYTFPLPINDTKLVEGLEQNPGYEKTE